MKKDNFFSKLKNNIYNTKTFSKYVKEGFWKSILYALILSLIIGGIQGIYMGIKSKNTISKSIEEFSNSKYDFSIKDGILNMKGTPIKVEEGSTVIYINSNKDLKEAESLKSEYIHGDMYVLVLKDGMKIGGNGISKELVYKDSLPGEVTNKTLIAQMNVISIFIVPIITIATIIQYFSTLLINCLIVAAFAVIIGTVMGLRMKITALYSLAIYAATLPSIIILPLSLIRPYIYFDNTFVVGTTLYVIFILRSIKSDLLKNIKENNL